MVDKGKPGKTIPSEYILIKKVFIYFEKIIYNA